MFEGNSLPDYQSKVIIKKMLFNCKKKKSEIEIKRISYFGIKSEKVLVALLKVLFLIRPQSVKARDPGVTASH